MGIEATKKSIDDQIKNLQAAKERLDLLPETISHHTIHVGRDGNVIITSCTTLDEVQEVRHAMRAALGEWKDELETVWNSGCVMLASWKSPYGIEIWLKTMPEDFPIDQISPGCRLVKSEDVSYSVVCEV
jgi:hypothetical protein